MSKAWRFVNFPTHATLRAWRRGNAAVKAAWTFLSIAGATEWSWPVGLKLGWTAHGKHLGWIAVSGACMLIGGA